MPERMILNAAKACILASLLTSMTGNAEPSQLMCAFRCVASQGWMHTTRNKAGLKVMTATRSPNALPLAEVAWEMEDSGFPGWIWLKRFATQEYASALAPPEKPPWVFVAADRRPTRAGLFRIEHVSGGWYFFSNHTNGYVNCVEGGLLRGHGYFPNNNVAATREPSTEFELVALNESQVRASMSASSSPAVNSAARMFQRSSRSTGALQQPGTSLGYEASRAALRSVALSNEGSSSGTGIALTSPYGDLDTGAATQDEPSRGIPDPPPKDSALPSSLGEALARNAAISRRRRRNKNNAGSSSGPSADGAPPPVAATPKTCKQACKWSYEEESGDGYPTPAFSGPLGNYLCPSMFRDLSDYVFKWPFSHFGERATTAPQDIAAKCLPVVPIVYAHAGTHEAVATWSKQVLKRPYILMTGQSDWPASRSKLLLGDPHLVAWFAQNGDLTHPKLHAIPIGLNCFEHAPELNQALKLLAKSPKPRTKTVLVNFGNTHGSRKQVWEHFCGKQLGKGAKFATCSAKAQQNNVKGNPHLVAYYRKMAEHQFVVAPRGNGWDTHRLWEALYLGCVPIVESGPLDALYNQLGGGAVLIVKDWAKVTEASLQAHYSTLKSRGDFLSSSSPSSYSSVSIPLLHRPHWRSVIEAARTNAIRKLGLEGATGGGNASRARCWG